MHDESPRLSPLTEEPPTSEAPARDSLARRLGRWAWNTCAVFGILAIVAMIGGFIYGSLAFRGLTGPPEQTGPTRPALPSINFTMPEGFVQADLTPIEPLAAYPLGLSALSLINPVEKVLIFGEVEGVEVEPLFTAIERSLVQADLGYTCGPGSPEKLYQLSSENEAELVGVLDCVRPLNAAERRIAQARKGHSLVYVFEREESFLLVQLLLPDNKAMGYDARARAFLAPFTWK